MWVFLCICKHTRIYHIISHHITSYHIMSYVICYHAVQKLKSKMKGGTHTIKMWQRLILYISTLCMHGAVKTKRQQIKFVSSQLPFIDVFFAIACSVRAFNYILSRITCVAYRILDTYRLRLRLQALEISCFEGHSFRMNDVASQVASSAAGREALVRCGVLQDRSTKTATQRSSNTIMKPRSVDSVVRVALCAFCCRMLLCICHLCNNPQDPTGMGAQELELSSLYHAGTHKPQTQPSRTSWIVFPCNIPPHKLLHGNHGQRKVFLEMWIWFYSLNLLQNWLLWS